MIVHYVKSPPPIRILIMGDLHYAVRDRAAWALFEMFRRTWLKGAPGDHLISLGDLVEFATVGKWLDLAEDSDGVLHTPNEDELDAEIQGTRALLARWRREHPTAEITALGGNHEYRLARFAAASARPLLSLQGAFNIPQLWDLPGQSISYTPYGRGKVLPYGPQGLWVTHGTKTGAHPAKTELNLWHRPGVSGHCHRGDEYGRRGPQGWMYWKVSPCLCRLDPTGTWAINPSWDQGWIVGEYHPDSQHLNLEIVRVSAGRLVWREHTWSVDEDAAA